MSKKNKKGVVWSTDPDYEYQYEQEHEDDTLNADEQLLYISLDKKQRKGKAVTLIEGFIGTTDDLKALGKELKSICGVGGTSKDGEILIQGDMRNKVCAYLDKKGYKYKRKGG